MLSKSLIIFVFLTILIHPNLFAQENYQDVVYLKNGSIIHGMIIEQIPGKSLKIQTVNNDVFVFSFDDIDKITKEKMPEENIDKTTHESSILKKHSGGKKSPAISFVLSFLVLPGAGQVYNGEAGKGISQFLLVLAGYGTAIAGANKDNSGMVAGGFLLGFGCSLWSWIDAPISASRINEERGYSKIQIPKRTLPVLSFCPIKMRKGKIESYINMTFNF